MITIIFQQLEIDTQNYFLNSKGLVNPLVTFEHITISGDNILNSTLRDLDWILQYPNHRDGERNIFSVSGHEINNLNKDVHIQIIKFKLSGNFKLFLNTPYDHSGYMEISDTIIQNNMGEWILYSKANSMTYGSHYSFDFNIKFIDFSTKL
jgi:hypothetical protein